MNNNASVSYYNNIRDIASQEPPVTEVVDVIRNGELKDVIDRVRAIKRTGTPQEYATEKTRLPAVTWSGTFAGRHNKQTLKQYNNLICIDIDHCDVEAVKNKLKDDPHAAYAFISPGGDGIKAIVQFAPSVKVSEWNEGLMNNGNRDEALRNIDRYHVAQFNDLRHYFLENYNITIDDVCSDYSRLCFMSHDENIYNNPNPIPRPTVEIVEETPQPTPIAPDVLLLLTDDKPEDSGKWTLGQVEWRLHLIPADAYGVWRNIGWALKDAYNTTEAFNIFVGWSKKSPKFISIDNCKEMWNSTKDTTTAPVTLNTIAMYYWKEVDRCVYGDKEHKGELYTKFISLKDTHYKIEKWGGYKTGTYTDVVRDIKDYLKKKYILLRKRDIDFIINDLKLIADTYPCVSVLEKGIHRLSGEYYLVEKSSEIITPVEGEWNNIKNLMDTLPPKDREWLYSRLQLDLIGYNARSMSSKGHAIGIIGDVQTGKTTIAKIIRKLLGGYAAPCAEYLGGNNKFNREMMMYCVWLIDDNLTRPNGARKDAFQEKIKELIKFATVQDSLRFEGKNKNPVVIGEMYRRLIITLNNTHEILELLPNNKDGITDKYSLLQCIKKFNESEFNEQLLWDEIPTFAYFLLNVWTKPDWIRKETRLGIVNYHNENIDREIYEHSITNELLVEIRLIMGTEGSSIWNEESKTKTPIPPDTNRTDTAGGLYSYLSQLVTDKKMWNQVKEFKKISVSNFGHQLRDMEKKEPTYVAKTGKKGGTQLWKIDINGGIYYGNE